MRKTQSSSSMSNRNGVIIGNQTRTCPIGNKREQEVPVADYLSMINSAVIQFPSFLVSTMNRARSISTDPASVFWDLRSGTWRSVTNNRGNCRVSSFLGATKIAGLRAYVKATVADLLIWCSETIYSELNAHHP